MLGRNLSKKLISILYKLTADNSFFRIVDNQIINLNFLEQRARKI